jgi:RHS repeat-associated protein
MSTNSSTLVWNTENQPISITSSGTTDTYTYDADNSRIKKVRGNTTTHYIGGLAEEDVPKLSTGTNPTRSMYTFNGQVIAQRTVSSTGAHTLVYLHSDHLGSVGASTTSAGASLSSQEYDPWGKVRTGGVTQSKYNYTGQKLDDTGLLFYNARYYDPLVGRFTSPDSIVSYGENRSDEAEVGNLTVDFHAASFVQVVSGENAATLEKGFGFQRGYSDSNAGYLGGPGNAQALNRYAYVANNPLRYTDPTGRHWDPEGPPLRFPVGQCQEAMAAQAAWEVAASEG